MIQFKSDHGDITVSSAVFSNITGMAATNCFGVKGMAYRSMTDGLVHLLRRLGQSALVLLAVSFVSFMVFRHIGDPTISLLGEDATVAEREALTRLTA